MIPLRFIGSSPGTSGARRIIERNPLLVLLARDGGEPLRVIQVPTDGAPHAAVETLRRRPAEFAADLRGVDRVAKVVAGAVPDESHQRFVVAARPLFAEDPADRAHDVEVPALGVAADVVGLPGTPSGQNRADGGAMVADVEPIPYVAPVA